MNVAIVGGAGRISLAATYDFIESKDVDKILLTDINEEALRIRKELVNSDKVSVRVVDLKDTEKLAEAFQGYDVVLNGAGVFWNVDVMKACLISKSHYTDFGGLFHYSLKQLKMHDDFKAAGITAIAGSGSAPGYINVMAKYAVDRLDTVDSVLLLDAVMNPGAAGYKFSAAYQLKSIIEEFTKGPMEFVNGEWVEGEPFSGKMTVDLPEPYGQMDLYNTLHSEVATMPLAFKDKGIKNVAFKLAMPAGFTEKLRFLIENGMASTDPITVAGQTVIPKDVLLEVFETKPGTVSNKKPTDIKLVRVVVTGIKDGKNVKYEIDSNTANYGWGLNNGHFTVGFPGAVTVKMLGNGIIKERGVYAGESVIDTAYYFAELKKRDMIFTVKTVEEI